MRKFGKQSKGSIPPTYKSRLRGLLRRLWMQENPDRNELLAEKAQRRINPDTGRMRKHWPCADCGDWVTEIKVDHIEPIGKMPSTYRELGKWLARLNCGRPNLQLLCFSCHQAKTNTERGVKY